MSRSNYDKILQEWAKTWKDENLSPEVRKLISQANYDLYYGPIKDGAYGDPAEGDEEWNSYPGFVTATKTIADALDDIPSVLYIDTDAEYVSEQEPKPEKCEECNGEGTIVENVKCAYCHGLGCFEDPGYWWRIERSEIYAALVGKELSHYL